VYEDQPGPDRLPAGISGGVCVNHLWPVVAGGGGMKDEALKLALEALENFADVIKYDNEQDDIGCRACCYVLSYDQHSENCKATKAITAIKQAPPAQPAVPDVIHHTDLSEHPQYIEGWNDCRAEMLKGMKP
jgi:hypothetical protein